MSANKKRKVFLHFNYPNEDKMVADTERLAVSEGVSYEKAVILKFSALIEDLVKIKKNLGNYFGASLGILLGDSYIGLIEAPSCVFHVDSMNGINFPVLVFDNSYATNTKSGEKVFISKSIFREFGMQFERELGFEFDSVEVY